MSEVTSRTSASRGRGSGRGGRGGFAGRGGRRTNGDKPDHSTADSQGAFEDEGDFGELRKQYGDKTSVIREMFPDWSEADVLFALQETNGDENEAVTRIAEGTISQWGEVSKPKKASRAKVKDQAPASSNDATSTGPRATRGGRAVSEGGRGRGRATDRGGRSTRGRSSVVPTNGAGTKDSSALSVPTEESSAWGTKEPKKDTSEENQPIADQPAPSATTEAPKPAAPAVKTWASMLPDETTPVVDTATPTEVPHVNVEPEVALPPSKDELTESNLEQVVDESKPPPTGTVASTAADSWDPRQNPASVTATPISAAQQQHAAPPSGFAATAAKATAERTARTPSHHHHQRRVLDQEEAVRMPGNREVDRAAVQFGAFSLNGDEDIDGDREEPETRAQPPADSPITHPRTSLPPATQAAVPDSFAQKPTSTVAPIAAPTAPAAQAQAQIPGQGPASAQQYGRFGQAGVQETVGTPQKPLDPFNQQSTPSTQPPFDNFAAQTSQAQQPGGAFSSAPSDYSSYYTANQSDRNPYNYYGQQFGQQGGQGQQDGTASQQRPFGGYGASQVDNLSQYPQSGLHNQPRFGGSAVDAQNSGNSTPNPTTQAQQQQPQQPGQQQQQQPGQGSQPQSHGQQYPGYNHPYYSNPYYHQYYSGYGQGGFGPYGKGGMYGQPYGISPNAPYDHSSSPAGFAQSSLHRDSGLGSGLGDYGRAATTQAGSQPGLGGSTFNSVHDTFNRGGSAFPSQGQSFNSPAQPGNAAADDLKPFGEPKAASGPSPSLGGARPGSATNAPPAQSGLPPPQNVGAYGGYPSHLQGHGLHGSNAYGMGGNAGQEKIVPGDVIDNEESSHPLNSDNRPEENISSNDDGSGDAESVDSKDELRLSKARCIALVCTVTGASFLNTLASQSVVIILPQIGRALDVPDTRLQWVVSSYVLTFGCFLLLWGRIADIYGKRLIFILGSFWVTICCVVNAFIPTEIAFDLFRGLHGLGAAANVPTAIGILGTTFPPGKAKNYAFSAYAAGAPLGSVCGNLVSGLIAEWASWKWVFGALAIMAGMIAVAGVFCIPAPPPELRPEHNNLRSKTAAVDWIGATLITCGLLALMFALTEGNVVGWTAPWIPVLIVVSFGVIVAFFFWQRYLEQKTNRPPLVKVSIFSNWRFTAVMIIMGFFFGGFNNYLIYATYYFQDYQGLSPLQTMLRFIPTGVSGFVVAFFTAYFLSRVPTFFILAFGHVAVCIAAVLYAVPIPPTTSYFAWGFWAMILSVVGADTAWPCLTLFTSHSLPKEDQAVGGALINSSGMIGRAIALAIATSIQSSVMAKERGVSVQDVGSVKEWDAPSLKGLRAGAWTNFGILFIALALVVYTFRSMEIIGKIPDRPERSEGVVNEEDTDVERRG
ncbi:hypothetical protein ACJA88_008512 [Fusarium oxysporum]